MVQPPKISKLPSPKAEAAKANRGKQHGEKKAVRKSPAVPNLSMLVNFIIMKGKILNHVSLYDKDNKKINYLTFIMTVLSIVFHNTKKRLGFPRRLLLFANYYLLITKFLFHLHSCSENGIP
jgi:hypothetical protein